MKVKYPGSTQAPMPLDSYVNANPRDFTAYIIHTYKNSNNQFESKRYRDEIKSIKIETTGINGKFFGVSYCQKLSVSFIDKDKKINFSKNDEIAIFLCPTEKYNAPDADSYYNVAYAPYFIDSFKRNEKTGEVSAIGYDIMGVASNTPFSLGEGDSFTLQQIFDRCKTLVGMSGGTGINVSYLPESWTREQINLSGKETVRDILTAIAEITGSFIFIYPYWTNDDVGSICFYTHPLKQRAYTQLGYLYQETYIDKSKYFELTSDKPYKLTGIASVNELEDVVAVGTTEQQQVIYSNPFLTLLPDETQQTILTGILNQLKDISFTPFNCEWRGDPRLEPMDWLTFEDKNGNKFTSYMLNETFEYNGGCKSTIWWEGAESERTDINSKSISNNILKTKATVDKVKGEITLEVSRAKDAEQLLGSRITLNENAITAEVKNRQDADSELSSTITQTATEIRQEVKNTTDGLDSKITQTANSISAEITARENADSELSSAITQTATEIRQEVKNTTDGLDSKITQTANSISAEITARENADTELSTRITANENGITSEVSRATGKENELASDISTITQNVDNISTRIDTVEGDYSTINQTVNEISLEVGNKADANGGAIISLINADTSTAKISADKITLEGEVSFIKKGDNVSELANDKGYLVGDDLGATGATVIDGGRITTGIISANRLDLSGTLAVGSNISQLTNDTGFITDADVPTKTSELINDSGFLDSSDTVDFAKLSKLKDANYTIINGGNITTGTIQAGVVFAGSLNGAEGNFTNLTTSGSISNGSNGFYINWYGSSGNAFVGYSTGSTGFAGLQFVPSLNQIYMIGGGNSILFNGSGTSYINLGTSSYVSADRFITKNYGTSLPSSGSTGEVFYKVVS